MEGTGNNEKDIVVATPKLLVIGCGGCGANALDAVMRETDPEENPHLSLMAIETNGRVIQNHFIAPRSGAMEGNKGKWLTQGKNQLKLIALGNGLGAGGDVLKGEELAKAHLEQIQEHFHRFDEVVMIGGGGGGTGGAMPAIGEALADASKPTYAILTMPRLNEGPAKQEKALRVKNRMLELHPTAVINNEKMPNKGILLSEVYLEINKYSLFRVLRVLRSLIQDVGNVTDLDATDWNNGLKVGKYSLPGFFDASRGLEGLREGLLGNPYLDARIIKRALTVDFVCEGKWLVEEQDRVAECIWEEMKEDSRDQAVEFKWLIKEEDVPEGVKTVGFVSFAKDPPSDRIEEKLTINIPIALNTPVEANGHRVEFEGVINGEKVKAMVTPEIPAEYSKLWCSLMTPELYERAAKIQAKLEEQTGLIFDVPRRFTVSVVR